MPTTSALVPAKLDVPAPYATAPFDVPHTLLLPPGWRAELWARLDGARFAAWTPTGELLVSVPTAGEIVRLIPADDPATPPLQRVLIEGILGAQGLAFDRGSLYVAQSNRLLRYRWPALGHPTVQRLRSFGARSVAVAPGHTIIVAGGYSLYRQAGRRVLQQTAPNSQGVAVDPDGRTWLVVNDIGSGPDRVTTAAGGEHAATVFLHPHSAPLGLHFLARSPIPEPWRNGAVVALHGAAVPADGTLPAVLWLPWHGSRLGKPVALARGFRGFWGRPVDAVPGPDGSLYVTDDAIGAVYRLTPP